MIFSGEMTGVKLNDDGSTKDDFSKFLANGKYNLTVDSGDLVWELEDSDPKFELTLNDSGDIDGPWPDVVEAYLDLTVRGKPSCYDCEVEMLRIDRGFSCVECDKRYHVGAKGKGIFCFRGDVGKGCMDKVSVPNKWIENQLEFPDIEEEYETKWTVGDPYYGAPPVGPNWHTDGTNDTYIRR